MRRLFLLFLPFLLVACSPAASQIPVTDTSTVDFSATKLYQLTAEMLTVTANQPKNDATITAIMANKYALGTSMAETMTAIPTLTPTPTIPPESPPCRAQDLQAAFMGAMGATQSIVFGVNLTNVKGLPCYLQLWPQAILVNGSGNPLDIQFTYNVPSDLTFDAEALLGLAPERTAGFSFQWGNWCMPAILGGVSIRLTMAQDGGTLTILTGLTAGGVCNDSGSPSWVGISSFSRP